MKGWNAGRYVAPSERAREAGRESVYIPLSYAKWLAVLAGAGLVLGAVVAVLAFFGVRPQ